jgi:hypothetical protein
MAMTEAVAALAWPVPVMVPLITGVVRVGVVNVLVVKVWFELTSTILTPSMETTPADTLASVVSEACPSSREPTPRAVEVDEVSPDIGSPVALVRVAADGVPRFGVTRTGDVEKTRLVEAVPVVPVAALR